MPFIDRMGWVFLISVAVIVVVSLIEQRTKDVRGPQLFTKSAIRTDPVFAGLAFGIVAITTALYIIFW